VLRSEQEERDARIEAEAAVVIDAYKKGEIEL